MGHDEQTRTLVSDGDNNMKNETTPPVLPNKRVTFLKVVFLKIEDINTINECFSGMFFIKSKWREPALDGVSLKKLQRVDWSDYWNPQLGIQNDLGNASVKLWRDFEFGRSGETFAVEKRRVKGTFTEKMELQEFPFDIQDLSLLITSELPEEEVVLKEDLDDISNVVTNSFVDESEWRLMKFVQSEPRVTHDVYVQKRYRKPGMYFRCCVIRRAGFFIWNIMLVMSIISSLSFMTFAVRRDLPQNRLQMSFILVLAGVTFKFAASQSVPKISYLTHLDRHIIGSMLFLFVLTIWHGFVSLFDYDSSRVMDFCAFVSFIALYAVLHLTFITSMMIRGLAKRKEIKSIEKKYLERLEEAMAKKADIAAVKKRRPVAENKTQV